MDTFGNTGDLRIPAQHTAPGTFVNSAWQGLERLNAAQTGSNPFFTQQFTGMPQTQYGNGGAPGGRVMPAQTGPAGAALGGSPFGAQAGNPFGKGQQQQQQSQDLIQF